MYMTRMVQIASFVWLGMLLSFSRCAIAQVAPLGALPMRYNGSFAGETGTPRINANVGYSGGEVYGSRNWGFDTSYDQFIPAIRSGVGVVVGHGNSKGDMYSSSGSSVYLSFAPKFSIKGKYTISPSLDFSYAGWYVKYKEGSYWDTIQLSYTGKYRSMKSRVGILFNANKFYAGYSISIMERIVRSDVAYSIKGLQSYLQLGYVFERSATSKFAFTPQLLIGIAEERRYFVSPANYNYKIQINLEAINLNFRYKQVIAGVNNAGFHIGWQNDHIRVMMSNNLRRIAEESGYMGNLSFRYVFNSKSANVIRY